MSCTDFLKVRTVPRSMHSCGMTFQVSPAWIWVVESDRGVHRIEVARHDRLQRGDDVRADHHRVDAVMRHGAVRAHALDDDLEDVIGGHHRAGADGEAADRDARDVVHAVDAVDRELVEQPLLDHDPAAALVLLGRLEDEIDGAVEIPGLGEILGGAQQHHRVAVVAAGMHLAGDRRLVVEAVGLVHVERIHVGAQADRPLGIARPQHAHHAGLGEAAVHLDAERFQLVCNDVGGAHFLEGRLGVAVDIVPPRGHVLVKRGDAVDHRHTGLSKIWERIVSESGDGSSATSMRHCTSDACNAVCAQPATA